MTNDAVFSIFQGNAKTMYLKAVLGACLSYDPLDLSQCTEIDVALPLADGTIGHRTLSQTEVVITTPAVLGKFSVPLDSQFSALLNIGEYQTFEVTFTIGSQTFTVSYDKKLSVFGF